MAALVNGLMMLVIVALIVYETIQRLRHPTHVEGIWVIVIASLGLVVNGLVAAILSKTHQTLNVRAALLHVVGDLLGSVAALVAGIGIYFTGWLSLDPMLSLIIAALILFSTTNLLRETIQILMEGVPGNVQIEDIGRELLAVPGVRAIHDLHVWSVSSHQTALSAHVEIVDLSNWVNVLETARITLRKKFGIEHITLQPELSGGLKQPHKIQVPIISKR